MIIRSYDYEPLLCVRYYGKHFREFIPKFKTTLLLFQFKTIKSSILGSPCHSILDPDIQRNQEIGSALVQLATSPHPFTEKVQWCPFCLPLGLSSCGCYSKICYFRCLTEEDGTQWQYGFSWSPHVSQMLTELLAGKSLRAGSDQQGTQSVAIQLSDGHCWHWQTLGRLRRWTRHNGAFTEKSAVVKNMGSEVRWLQYQVSLSALPLASSVRGISLSP